MKKTKQSQRYFRELFTLCLLVISGTIFILSFFFYHKYTEALRTKIFAIQEKELENSSHIMNDVSGEISQLYNTLIVDTKVISFFTLEKFDPVKNYETYLIVKKLYNINPMVNSLYIYNCKADDTITCGSPDFNLEECWNKLLDTKTVTILPSTLINNNEKVLTFCFPYYSDSFDHLTGGIFISLNMERLSQHVLGEDKILDTRVILDQNKKVLVSSSEKNIFSIDQNKTLLKNWILTENSDRSSTLRTLVGQKYLCTSYKDANQGFLYLSAIPYKELVLPMLKQRNLYLLVAGTIFLIAVLIQYIIAKKLYKPIETITKELKESKYAEINGLDEFSLIRHVYENALSEIEILEKKQSFAQSQIKADLLKSLLLGNQEITIIQEQLKKNNWNIPFDGMFLCCFLIEEYNENELMTPVIQTTIQQLLYTELGINFYIECISIGSKEVIGFINNLDNQFITFENLVQHLENVKIALLDKYEIKLTISLDGMITDITSCHRIYSQVLDLINYRFVFGYNQIIYPKLTLELLPEVISYPDKLESKILICLIQGHAEEFKTNVAELVKIIRQYHYEAALLLFHQMKLNALFQLKRLTPTDKNYDLNSEIFKQPKTLEEGTILLSSIYDKYQLRKKETEDLKDNKHYEKIEESKKYINEHYSDANLCAGMIAEYLNYSTNYFSKVFKSITGFYINDYIRQIRISKSQELLLNSDMTITAIALETGFSNQNYFYSIFKKETGLTPAAYRNSIK